MLSSLLHEFRRMIAFSGIKTAYRDYLEEAKDKLYQQKKDAVVEHKKGIAHIRIEHIAKDARQKKLADNTLFSEHHIPYDVRYDEQ